MQDLPSQQTASPAPLCSAQPGLDSAHPLLLKPTKFFLAKICQSHPSPNFQNLRQRQLCYPRAHEKLYVGPLILLLSGPLILPLKCLLSSQPALTVVLSPQKFQNIVPKLYLIIQSLVKNLLGPQCPESAPLHPPRPTCHPC